MLLVKTCKQFKIYFSVSGSLETRQRREGGFASDPGTRAVLRLHHHRGRVDRLPQRKLLPSHRPTEDAVFHNRLLREDRFGR